MSSPAPGAQLAPSGTIRLTLSRPVSQLFGSATPTLVPATPGHWSEPDSHTLLFTPSGVGVPLATTLRVVLPHAVIVVGATGATGASAQPVSEISWTTPRPSTLRLQQLLAQLGYLPVRWLPSAADVPRTAAAQLAAAVRAADGSFAWRYSGTPRELTSRWTSGTPNVITRGRGDDLRADARSRGRRHRRSDGLARAARGRARGPPPHRPATASCSSTRRSRSCSRSGAPGTSC